jgi:hypothetical protein
MSTWRLNPDAQRSNDRESHRNRLNLDAYIRRHCESQTAQANTLGAGHSDFCERRQGLLAPRSHRVLELLRLDYVFQVVHVMAIRS